METRQVDRIKEESEKAMQAIKPLTVKYKTYNYKTSKIEKRELTIKSGKEGSLFNRIVIIAFFIIAELVLLTIIYTHFIITFLWFLFIPYGIGIIIACRVAVSNKNYDSKIAWILFLLILAPVAVFVYLLAGEMNMFPSKFRKLKKINESTKYLQKTVIPEELPARIKQECTYIQNTSDFVPFYDGTAVYFPRGEDFFEDVLAELKKSQAIYFYGFFYYGRGSFIGCNF